VVILRGRVPQWNQLSNLAKKDLKNWKNWFTKHQNNDDMRLTALNLYVKLKSVGLWKFVSKPTGRTSKGALDIIVPNIGDLKDELRKKANFATPGASSTEWESGEERMLAALHFKHYKDWGHAPNVIQVHIDLFGHRAGIVHLKTLEGYKNIYRIRNLLLAQGLDNTSLLAGASSPPPKPPIKGPKQPIFGEHVVKKGEVLSRIALKYGTTVKDIAKLNPWLLPRKARTRDGRILKGVDYIKIGETIKVPSSPPKPRAGVQQGRYGGIGSTYTRSRIGTTSSQVRSPALIRIYNEAANRRIQQGRYGGIGSTYTRSRIGTTSSQVRSPALIRIYNEAANRRIQQGRYGGIGSTYTRSRIGTTSSQVRSPALIRIYNEAANRRIQQGRYDSSLQKPGRTHQPYDIGPPDGTDREWPSNLGSPPKGYYRLNPRTGKREWGH
jgi:hypothetical protein